LHFAATIPSIFVHRSGVGSSHDDRFEIQD
jgi:hypothetical protein